MEEEKTTWVNLSVFQAIPRIMLEMEPIAKAKRNTIQNFNFRGIDDIYNNLQGLMAKYGVFSVPVVLSCNTEERTTKNGGLNIFRILTIQYDFYGSDGSKFSATVQGEGADMGDKASNKAMAIAHKYALMQVFAIPTEDIDPDGEIVEPMAKEQKTVQAKQEKPKEFDAVKEAEKVCSFINETDNIGRLDAGFAKFKTMESAFRKSGTMDIYKETLRLFEEKHLKLFAPPEGEVATGGGV